MDQSKLPKPFFVLAPMDDVTDTVFRQIVASTTAPDMYFTEFVNVDGLQSPGRPMLLPKLAFSSIDHPLVVQLWGKNPENYYKCAREIADGTLAREVAEMFPHLTQNKENLDLSNRQSQQTKLSSRIEADEEQPGSLDLSEVQGVAEERTRRTNGTSSEHHTKTTQQFAKNTSITISKADSDARVIQFSGIDINMGCPAKPIIQNGCCSALINNRGLTGEILQAVREGVGPDFPVSVKTRLGFKHVDLTWHEFLLQHKLNMLTIHGRTTAQMSKTDADWDKIGEIAKIRTSLSPQTLIVGNGDIMTRQQGLELAEKHGLDGIMIGRGIFHDPYV
ncbi:MAG: tRNA-dihydrouridine synthase, partial [Patescibacteria group bacterium]|nr:tRNA-dihydrouridine synthase [Patescibacteria group bacterium]